MKTVKLLFLSAVMFGTYGEIVRKKLPTVFRVLFFIVLLFGSIHYLILAVSFSDFVERNKRLFVSEIPSFRFTAENGLIMESKTPVVFQMGSFLFVMDDSDISEQKFMEKYGDKIEGVPKALEVSRHFAVVKSRPFGTIRFNLDKLDFIAPFSKEDILAKMHYWRYFAWGLFPVFIVHFFLLKLFFVFILSLSALPVNRLFKWNFSYTQLFAAGAFALMPPSVFGILICLSKSFLQMHFIFDFILSSIWLYLGLKKACTIKTGEIS